MAKARGKVLRDCVRDFLIFSILLLIMLNFFFLNFWFFLWFLIFLWFFWFFLWFLSTLLWVKTVVVLLAVSDDMYYVFIPIL